MITSSNNVDLDDFLTVKYEIRSSFLNTNHSLFSYV